MNNLSEVTLTQKEFDDLLDYSHSLPTGKFTGKRWKRKCSDGWLMGQYGEVEGDSILIHWKKIKILSESESLIKNRLYGS